MRIRAEPDPQHRSRTRGPKKIRKIVRPQCLHWVITTTIVKLQLLTYLWPENMVKLLRKNCGVPSSAFN